MKRFISLFIIMIMSCALLLSACSETTDNSDAGTPIPKASEAVTPAATPVSPDTPEVTNSPEPSATPDPTSTPEPTPTPIPGPAKVTLSNSSDSIGNNHYASSHYGLNIAYTGEYVTVMNYMTMLKHGSDTALTPEAIEGFEYQAVDMQYYNGLLYFLLYDGDSGEYYLHSYDFENDPVKVSDSTVYHYEFINGLIYFNKEFYQGTIYSMDTNGGGEQQLTTMRAHSFVSDGQSLYFYSTDAGNAPGLVEYNIFSKEENTVVFPFYSHNYLVHDGYVYYLLDANGYRSIHRLNLADQTVTDIMTEMSDYTVSMNISDDVLYILAGNSISSSNFDGSGITKIFEHDDYFVSGLYIFGDRIYCTDNMSIVMVKKDGSDAVAFPFN